MALNPVIPKKVFYAKGTGTHKDKLVAFEYALRDAGIQQYNLVPVSSIKPPGCEEISRDEGVSLLSPGQVVFCVFCRQESQKKGDVISASIGIAIPKDDSKYGYYSEYHATGVGADAGNETAERMALFMLATKLGFEVDETLPYEEMKARALAQGHIAKVDGYTVATEIEIDGLWSCVISAAVFVN